MLLDIAVNLFSDVIAVLFVILVWQRYKATRYGGWKMVVIRDGQELKRRIISQKKAEAILDDDSDLSVYAKGVISPFAWLNKDVLDLLKIDGHLKTIAADISGQPLPRGS